MLKHLQNFFTPPVFEDDEDQTHLAKLISYFAWVIFGGTFFFYIVWAVTSPELAWRLVYGIPLFPLSGIIFFLLYRKNLRAASLLIVAGIWSVLFISAMFNGGLHAPAMGGFILVVLLAALMLGRNNALGFAGLSIVATLGLVIAQNQGLIFGERYATPIAIWASYTTYLVVAALILHLGTNNIQEALARARKEIGDRKATEEALRAAEIRYRTLVEKLPVVTYQDIPDVEGTSLYISPQIEKLTGYAPEKWRDDPQFWQKLLHPEDYDRAMSDIERYLAEKTSSVIEYRLKTREDNWVWVRDEADVLVDEAGDAVLVQGTLSDITDRKLAEEALRASEEKFNKAFFFSPFPMSISSPNQGYIEVNEAFVSMIGHPREAIIGHHALDIGFWAEQDEQRQAIDILTTQGWLRDFEFRFQRRSGEIGVGLVSGVMIMLNQEACALSSVFDLTHRKKAEEALRKSEDKFQKAFKFSPIAMAISSATRGYLDANEAFEKLTGYAREDILEAFSADLNLWRDTIRHQEVITEIRNRGFARDIEAAFRKKTGEEGIALASAVLIEFDNEQCILASLYDITDRKKSEAAVRASEEKFQKAFLSSPVSMMINSPAKGILNVNRAFEELTGFLRADILGKHAHEMGLWVDMGERQASIDLVRKNSSLHDFEFKFRKKDGSIRVGSLAVDLIDIDNEICYLASFQDITARKEAEDALRNLNAELEARVKNRTAQLEAANQELESFSYSISHDLRSPLRAINGFSRLLDESYHDHLHPEARRLLNLVQENALKMGRLIDDLLAFSRLGRSPLQMKQVSPTELVREVWHDLAHERGERKIRITIADLEPCRADASLLRQVYANLLSNAIKFTRPRKFARIEVGNQLVDGQTIYYVKDNGAGFSMEYANKLFGVFHRLHHENEFEGTGVGLATVQRIIHRHGGRIWAEAKPDKGAVFYFTLPPA